ncbi:integrin alpha-V-like [Ornithodoros turicata]|uniref:integrin alpha-V-like n=1 Tax=Ornithodoros turicata TaxID=34597 RepID=UPI0031392177
MRFTKKVYMHSPFVDELTPFDVRLSFDLIDPSNGKWCPNCPVRDPDRPLTTTETIPFKKECRKHDVCRSDLELDVTVSRSKNRNFFVVGEQTPVTLRVQVRNKDFVDPAYLARAVISVASRVRIINKGSCSVVQDGLSEVTEIVCDAGNPLRPGMTESFSLKLDVSHVLKTFTMNINATTTSEDIDLKDNVFSSELRFIHEADVAIAGIANPTVVDYNARTKRILMEHNVIITKYFASPINAVELTLHVPRTFNESATPFVTVQNIKVQSGDTFVSGTCRRVADYFRGTEDSATDADVPSQSTPNPIPPSRVHRSEDTVKSPYPEQSALLMEELSRINYYNVAPLNCITSYCLEIKCTLGPFLPMRARVALVTVTLLFDMPEFTKQAGILYAFAVGTEGRINILDDVHFVHDENRTKEASAITILQRQGIPASKPFPLWVIGGSVAGGLVAFSVMLATLIHVGFFRRRHLEEMERMILKDQEQEWEPFMVTEDEVEEAKRFFRSSMMLGVSNGRLHFADDYLHGPEQLDVESRVRPVSAVD